jgi:hypothetical protein
MRKLFMVLMVLSAPLWAQSVVSQAPQEALNLAPRCQRGDAQVYKMQVEVLFLNADGKPMVVKKNCIDYTQLCLSNTPDSGLIYDITIDTFSVGTPRGIDESTYDSRSIVDSLVGLHFRSQFRPKIPVAGNCCDFGMPLTSGFPYMEAFEFIDDFLPAKIMEQLHCTVGKRLSKVGDTATIALPKPICYSIKEVVNESVVEQKPFKLTLTGLTSYRGTPCAVVSIESAVSPYRVDMYTSSASSFKAVGTSQITGEFQVSLKKGTIVYAKMSERLETSISETNKPVRKNGVLKNTELIPRVW